MSTIARFLSLGMEDADRRVAAALAAPSLEPADRYLQTSRFVMAIDRATRTLQRWWLASAASQAWLAAPHVFGEPSAVRYQGIALVLLTASIAHVMLTLLNGPRPGWFWLVIPAMLVMFATLLLAGSRSSHSTD